MIADFFYRCGAFIMSLWIIVFALYPRVKEIHYMLLTAFILFILARIFTKKKFKQ